MTHLLHTITSRTLTLTTLVITLFAGRAGAGQKAPERTPIKACIVDGQNNHNWRGTTPVLKDILEDAGLFTVDVATTGNVAAFKPDFSAYDVIVSNYNGEDWPEETQKAFINYMRSGGGLVIIHAADNSFPKWPAFNEMIGVGGWGGRNEKWGPMVYWEDGKIVRDMSPGGGGSHGPQHPYQVTVRDATHPITAGLPTVWMHAQDELYSNLRGPAKNMTVLATAFADSKKGGTGRHEPALLTISYGKGRIFHTILGHDIQPTKCMGFVFTFQRGTEWAATGAVTQKSIPPTFPTADRVRMWLPNALFECIKTYDFGASRKDLTAIEKAIRGAAPSTLRMFEEKLLAALTAPETKFAGKQFALRVLRRIGTATSVEPIAALLTDKTYSHMARYALQRLPAPEATAALANLLGKVDDNLAMGLIGSLADRGDRSVVPQIAPYATHKNAAVAEAAIKALGKIGGSAADKTLADASIAREFRPLRDDARLLCADSLLADGKAAEAAAIYDEYAGRRSVEPVIRLAAYGGLLKARGEGAVPTIMELLSEQNRILRQGAVRLLVTTPGSAVTRSIVAAMKQLQSEQQSAVLAMLVTRGDRAAYPAVIAGLESSDATVQLAAIKALGTFGRAADVPRLTKLSTLDSELAGAALESLTTLKGDGVTEAIAATLKDTNHVVRANAIQVLLTRRTRDAVPAFISAARDASPAVRAAACKALGMLAGPKEFPKVADLLVTSSNAADRANLLGAVRDIAKRLDDKDASSAAIAGAIKGADADTTVRLLELLPVLSTDAGLAAVRTGVKSDNAAVARAAIAAMASWQNAAPLRDLLALAKDASDPSRQAPAMTGYSKLLGMPADRPSRETVELIGEALKLAKAPADRKRLVASLGRFPCREGLALAESLAADPQLGEEAKKAGGAIKSVFLRGSFVATASHGGNETKNAFDGKLDSRWATGTPMRPGMWFMLDLGVEQGVKKLILDTRGSAGDYPRGSEVYVSFDGKTWGKKPVLTSKPQGPMTTLTFSPTVHARYLKIVQTGSVEGLFWSIHEMKVELE